MKAGPLLLVGVPLVGWLVLRSRTAKAKPSAQPSAKPQPSGRPAAKPSGGADRASGSPAIAEAQRQVNAVLASIGMETVPVDGRVTPLFCDALVTAEGALQPGDVTPELRAAVAACGG